MAPWNNDSDISNAEQVRKVALSSLLLFHSLHSRRISTIDCVRGRKRLMANLDTFLHGLAGVGGDTADGNSPLHPFVCPIRVRRDNCAQNLVTHTIICPFTFLSRCQTCHRVEQIHRIIIRHLITFTRIAATHKYNVASCCRNLKVNLEIGLAKSMLNVRQWFYDIW